MIGWISMVTSYMIFYLHVKKQRKKLPKFALFDLARLCEKLSAKPPELSALRLLLDDFSGIPPKDPPEDLQASLRPYQKVGYNWLSF